MNSLQASLAGTGSPRAECTVVWQGGAPPLGYGLAKQRLVVEPVEAKKVRNIFDRFLQQPSVTALIQELSEQGVKTGYLTASASI